MPPRWLSALLLRFVLLLSVSCASASTSVLSASAAALKICLTISFVSSSQALMSSARIPLLSGDLPFFEFPDRILQFFTRDFWYSRHFFSVADVHVSVPFISIFVLLIVVVIFLWNSPKTLAIPLRSVMISPRSFLIFVMITFFFCRFDSRDVSDTFEVFEKFLDYLLSFHSFLVSDIFFDAFAQLFHSLFLFFGCTSPQFDESSDFRVLS